MRLRTGLAAMALTLALCAPAQASLIAGTYHAAATFNDTNHTDFDFQMYFEYDSVTHVFSVLDMESFDIDGTSFLSKGVYLVEDLSGRGRFRATFRNMPSPYSHTFEFFLRFVSDPQGQIVTSNIAALYTVTGANTQSTTINTTFTPGRRSVPEPTTIGLLAIGLGIVGPLARRRRGARASA